jgi:hypothetical protein
MVSAVRREADTIPHRKSPSVTAPEKRRAVRDRTARMKSRFKNEACGVAIVRDLCVEAAVMANRMVAEMRDEFKMVFPRLPG